MGGGFGGDTVTDSNFIRDGRMQINDKISSLMNLKFVVRPRPGDIHGDGSNSVEQFKNKKNKNYFKSRKSNEELFKIFGGCI